MSACPSEIPDDYLEELASNFSPNSTVIYDYYDIAESAGQYWQYDVSIVTVKYVWPLIFFVGTIGNILTFIVLIRRRMQRTPVYFYLAMLACADTCVLYLSGAKTWLRVVTGLEILHLSDASCRVCMFLFLQSLHLSAFFVVAMTTDRFFTVFFPLKRPRYRFLQNAKLFSFLAFLLLAAYNCHIFWTFGLKIFSDGWKTCAPVFPSTFMCDIFPWLKLSLYTVVPFILVLTLNCATVYRMYKTHAHFRNNSDSWRSNSRISMSQYRVTIMLLGVSVSWLLLTAPFTMFIFISNAGETTGTTLEDDAKFFFFKTICFSLLYINHGINFYIYCLSGRRFRKEFLEVIVSVRRWSIRSRMTSSVAIRASNREPGFQASKPIVPCIVENPDYEMKRPSHKSLLKRKTWNTADI